MVDDIKNSDGKCLVVSVPINNGIADFIGKKGAEDSLTYYNRIYNKDVIVAITPTDLEDKFYGLAESLILSDQIILQPKEINKLFGEILIAASLTQKRIILIEDDLLDYGKIDLLSKQLGITLEKCNKENIIEKIEDYKVPEIDNSDKCRVDIDKSFVVKGAGTVVLGIVKKGEVKVHDKLYMKDSKEVVVRSIQSQDRDVQEAPLNTRVGLALKGVDPDEFKKGDTLTNYKLEPKKVINGKIKLTEVNKEIINQNTNYLFASNFSYTNASVESFEGDSITLNLDRMISIETGDKFMLIRKNEPRIFAYGTVQ
jgi:selenocysteine-specific translation elongation factor